MMSSFRLASLVIAWTSIAFCVAPQLSSAEDFRPIDPIASIDGQAIFLGELNLLLRDQLGIRDPDNAKPEVKVAATLMLVRRHLALRSMRAQGGDALSTMIDDQVRTFEDALKRRRSDMKQHARALNADERSLQAHLAWQIAWGQYLKSKLTEKNLRSFYARQQGKYGGGRWDVSHLFLKIDSADPGDADFVTARMEQIIQELKAADSLPDAFADAAKEHSESGSSKTGGRVGWVEGTSDLPSAVMTAVRNSKPGQLVGPTRSPLGLHLVFVHQFEQKEIKFDEITNQAQLRRDATNALFDLLVKKQKNTKITWYINQLKPPADAPIIPE